MSRKPDEIMADYLLTGAKMLSQTCETCKAPLFEVNGKKFCVVCAENKTAAEKTSTVPDTIPNTISNPVSNPIPASSPKTVPVPENIRVIVPEYAKEPITGETNEPRTELAAALDTLIAEFCERAHKENDAGVCLKLMECIRTAAEAKMMLNRK